MRPGELSTDELMVAGVNTRIIQRGRDRKVIVWSRFHKTETELQRGMNLLDPAFTEVGFATYHFMALSRVEDRA